METKYSNKEIENSLPKWNSNIPKKNAIYLFANHSTMTFFMGDDYISPEIRELYLEHFKSFDEKQSIEETKKKILKLKEYITDLKNPFGLYPKIRIDYLDRKDFKISNKDEFKKNIFEYSSNNKWEKNVYTFLERLNNEE